MPGNASTHVQPSVLVQGDIFDLLENNGEVKGYRGVVASKIAGITYRQLDYWARKRILEPSINPSSGSGSRRLYSFKDILILAVSKRLLDTGVNLQNVTAAITFLNRQTVDALEHMTIICNGTSVRQCREDEQVLDLVEEGTAIFAVSVGKMWHEVDSALQDQPCVTVSSGAISEGLPTQPIEDLMERRMREKIETQRLERTKIA
ncbi:transcriptional regulator, MerR family [Bifidobacterium bohemicum DSM 22767]|uniref:Transcriptional regulator, MerR family n=2 Tax=Bifidobacterium bohemicum TaxID=638617 RepID=A0A086ZJB6_9BIFI|nr:transcriptional regulator, MerR family [Bifidobacterium bohemicum DSM 22767]